MKWGSKINRRVFEVIKYCQNTQTALDIGSGAGANSFFLKRNGFEQIDLIDINSELKDIVESKKKEFGVSELDFYESDIVNFEPEKKYDLIMAINILHFVGSNDLRLVFDKIYNFLNDQGIFYLRVFNTEEPSFKNMTEKSENNDFIRGNGQLIHYFSKEEINIIIERYQVLELADIYLHDNHKPGGEHYHQVFDVILRKSI